MRSAAKHFFATVAFLFVILWLADNSLAQGNNAISGFVFGLENKPVPSVTVELQDDLNRMISRTETNGAGRYNFSGLGRGRYNVKVFPIGTGYQEQLREVEITGIGMSGSGGAETVQQNFNLQLKPNSTAVANLKNNVVFAQDVPKEAQKIYEKAIDDLKDKKREAGIAELKQSLEIFPTYYLALERLAKEFIEQQDYKNALETANKCVGVNDKSYECWYVIGYSDYKFKNSEEAAQALEKAVLILPNSVNAYFLLGVNQRQIGKFEAAEASLLKAKKLTATPISDIHWHLALLYTNNLKKYKEAIQELELFLKAKPDFDETEKVQNLIQRLKEKLKDEQKSN
ncbi:MAG: carboxypeptidase regulatory-like domain-containing protein [Pyrinomonadaceae bacterium]|nr:carboxypeptidase regulatory-like domain-containing protein [Pyrinomonadaceae bacterium]